jgi:hypothetical protein
VRIAGIRISPEYARLLAEILARDGFDGAAARLAQAIDLQVTTEAPLTAADYEAVRAALQGDCPAGLRRLRTELDKDQRLRRGFAGGVG